MLRQAFALQSFYKAVGYLGHLKYFFAFEERRGRQLPAISSRLPGIADSASVAVVLAARAGAQLVMVNSPNRP